MATSTTMAFAAAGSINFKAFSSKDFKSPRSTALSSWYETRFKQSTKEIRDSITTQAFSKGATQVIRFTKEKTKHAKGVIAKEASATTEEVMQNIQVHNSEYISKLRQTTNVLMDGIGAQPFEVYVERKKQELSDSINEELKLYFQQKLEEIGPPAQ